jgi:hypothetical protein
VFSGSQLYLPEKSTGWRGGAAANGDELLVCPCEVPGQGMEREEEAGAVTGTAAADGADGWAAADGAAVGRRGQTLAAMDRERGACGGKCDSGCRPIPIRVWSATYICSGSFFVNSSK